MCAGDGELYYGWRTPQLWADQGGQPPDGPELSIPGQYVHSRYSTQSYKTCAEAEAAMNDVKTLPYKSMPNQKPTVRRMAGLDAAHPHGARTHHAWNELCGRSLARVHAACDALVRMHAVRRCILAQVSAPRSTYTTNLSSL